MAATYEPIAATTLSSAQSTVTFSNISTSYTDFVAILNYGVTSNLYAPRIRFNSDTGSNYSNTILYGNGTSATSERSSNATSISGSAVGVNSNSLQNTMIISIQNYGNSTTNKTVIGRHSAPSNEVNAFVGLWRNTNAITSITFFTSAGNLMSGSTFTLYGIKAA